MQDPRISPRPARGVPSTPDPRHRPPVTQTPLPAARGPPTQRREGARLRVALESSSIKSPSQRARKPSAEHRATATQCPSSRHVRECGFSIQGYADDHQIMKTFKPQEQGLVLSTQLQSCFDVTKAWMADFYLAMNDSKTQIIVFGSTKVLNEISLKGVNLGGQTTVRFVTTVKNLGIQMDAGLTLDNHIMELKRKCFHTLRNLAKIRFLLSTTQLKTIVNSLVISCLDYCNGMFYGISNKLIHQLQLIQNACAKAITGKYKHDHMNDDLEKLHWLNIRKRVLFKIGLLAYKSINGLAPSYLQELFTYSHHGHTLKLVIPSRSSKGFGDRSFSSIGPRFYNALPDSVRKSDTVDQFKSSLKTYLFGLSDEEVANIV
ncbi:hypothetical protein ACHWQZ_G017091 [Mnemiopsis leidyi]